MIVQFLSLFCVLRFLIPVLGKEGVNFRSWNSESNSSLFQSESLYDSTVGEYATIVSFGYISKANFPEWVYHNFMAGYDNDLSELMSLPCSVEILAIESISNRLGIQKNGGILHVAGHPDQVFSCLHPQTHTHAHVHKRTCWAAEHKREREDVCVFVCARAVETRIACCRPSVVRRRRYYRGHKKAVS